VIRLKHAVISLLFHLAAAVATAPLGALAILSRIMERIDHRRTLQTIRRAERAFNRAARKSWLDG
jgi:hypothetical protein